MPKGEQKKKNEKKNEHSIERKCMNKANEFVMYRQAKHNT